MSEAGNRGEPIICGIRNSMCGSSRAAKRVLPFTAHPPTAPVWPAPSGAWMLSGINHGANLGADIYYSGTVAAVREALLHGWPGIAFSLCRKSGVEFDWARAERWIIPVLTDLLARPIEQGVFYNVNLPLLAPEAPDPEVVWCPLDPKPLPLNYRHEAESGLYYAGDYNLRHRTPGADVDVCFGGRIAVTAVRLL